MARDDSSSSDDSSDSEEEEVMIALCELQFSTLALGPRLNLEDLSPLECEQLFRYIILLMNKMTVSIILFFRFRKNMFRLHNALSLPEKYVCSQGTVATGMESLMILLRRLSYPNRLSDLVQLFGRRKSELSLVFNMVMIIASYVLISIDSLFV